MIDKQLRFVLVKYPDRGLAEDVYVCNGSLRLFDILFWVLNLTLVVIMQGIRLAKYLREEPLFEIIQR